MTAVLTVLRVLTTVTSILLCLSPWPDFRRIIRDQSTGPLSVLPVLMLFINCYMWDMYAFLVGNWFPLFAVCVFGCVTIIFFIGIYYRWSTPVQRAKLHRAFALAAVFLAGWTAFVIAATAGATGQTNDEIAKILGYMCVVVNIGVYASPLDTMKVVIRTKSAAPLPISLCTMNLINGSLWVAFGAIEGDLFVLTPNALGVVFCTVQVGLYLKYRSNTTPVLDDDLMNTKGGIAEAVSPKPAELVDIAVVPSPSFHAVRSP